MLRRIIVTAFAAFAFAPVGIATTYFIDTQPDPFVPGQACEKPTLGSWGSYIYDAPSKYDLVFAPETEALWLARCETSGFVSLGGDMAQLTAAERKRIESYLKTVDGPGIIKAAAGNFTDDLLVHLERLYALRDMNAAFRVYFERYLAWQYGSRPSANVHRRKALDLYYKMPAGRWLKSKDDLERLYILGFYARKLGNLAESTGYFRELEGAWTFEFSTAKYLRTLAREVEAGKADDNVRFAKGT